MSEPSQTLQWIDSQRDAMLQLLCDWAKINSWTYNLAGLARFANAVESELGSLGVGARYHDLPPVESIDSGGNLVQTSVGKAISFGKRLDAPFKVFLNIHLDTVYPDDHPFQQVTRIDNNTLRGPGVADAKGGLVVMLTALRALERSSFAKNIGWEVLLNPDEEIGSFSSAHLLAEAARQNHAGLLFEPARPDGSLIGERMGSGNFTVIFHGRAAHVGRDFALGRSAILAMADFVHRLESSFKDFPNVIINCGIVQGGSAVNAVPDLAIARVNARASNSSDQRVVEQRIAILAEEMRQREGISVQLHGGFHSPPKPMDERSRHLFNVVLACGDALGIKLQVNPSGGACDGNKLVAAGLPVVDTLGPRGGNTHSDQEYIMIDSLAERAKLTTLVLLKLAEQHS